LITFSIVIPTYNRAKDLDRCLKSLVYQTFNNFEVLIGDDGSEDNTFEIVQSYKTKLKIKYFKMPNFGGPAKARNEGIKNAEGKYIAFLDSDDWWSPDKLSSSLPSLLKGADIVYHDLWLYGLKGIPSLFRRARTRKLNSPVYLDLLINGNALNNSSVIVKKEILDRVGLLFEDPELIAWEDYEYWIRISKITEKFQKIPKCLGYYWVGGGNISHSERALQNNESIKKRYESEFNLFYKRKNKYPVWLEYGSLIARIDLNKIDLSELVLSFSKLNLEYSIKVSIKYILKKIFNLMG
jgi:glycosyltransferase involved in cell wall biosynthesis